MSQETARYLMWILLCLPMLALGLYFLVGLRNDARGINRVKRARAQKIEEERQRIEDERRRREVFDEDYLDYQRRKYYGDTEDQ